MGWESLIFQLFAALIECIQDRRRESVEAGLRDPGLREAIALRRVLKKEEGLRGRALHVKVREGMDYLRDMDGEEISALVDEAMASVSA